MESEVKSNFQLVSVAAHTAPSVSLAQLRSMGFSAAAIGELGFRSAQAQVGVPNVTVVAPRSRGITAPVMNLPASDTRYKTL
jgi:hypothetical protein